MITCAEFVSMCFRFDSLTRGERASGKRHYMTCESCKLWCDERGKQERQRMSARDIADMETAASVLAATDRSDSEYMEVAHPTEQGV